MYTASELKIKSATIHQNVFEDLTRKLQGVEEESLEVINNELLTMVAALLQPSLEFLESNQNPKAEEIFRLLFGLQHEIVVTDNPMQDANQQSIENHVQVA